MLLFVFEANVAEQVGDFDEEEGDDRDADAVSVTSAATGVRASTKQVDKDYVRSRVKRALLNEGKKERRRIRVKGEASAVTRKRRDIAQSLKECPVWGGYND